jgi:RNA polymerase sigma-70 factor (ECF subfamily)
MSTAEFDLRITELVERLRQFIRRRVPDDATADDLTQETLLKVYRSRAALREHDRIEAWLYRIARRTLIDWYRRRKPAGSLPENLRAEAPDEIAALRAAVLRSTLRFLEELPEAYRVPLRLSELEGLTMIRIAERLNLSLTAVKARIRRGRGLLKKKLQACCRFEFDRHGRVIGWERRAPECCA